jgi:hypothetical protein
MKHNHYDKTFTEAFTATCIEHVRAGHNDNGLNNQPEDIIQDAIDGGAGKLSRLFDALPLPMLPQEELERNLKEAGSIENFMRPLLNQSADILLNGDRSRLSDDLIDAIGQDKYHQLLNRADIDREQQETEIARQVLAAVVVNYSQSFQHLMQSEEEKTSLLNLDI